MSTESAGPVVLLLGLNKAVGYPTAVMVASDQARIIAIATDRELVLKTRIAVEEFGATLDPYIADLANIDQVNAAVYAIKKAYDRIDAIVNVAGNTAFMAAADGDTRGAVLSNTLYVINSLVKQLAERAGKIINVVVRPGSAADLQVHDLLKSQLASRMGINIDGGGVLGVRYSVVCSASQAFGLGIAERIRSLVAGEPQSAGQVFEVGVPVAV